MRRLFAVAAIVAAGCGTPSAGSEPPTDDEPTQGRLDGAGPAVDPPVAPATDAGPAMIATAVDARAEAARLDAGRADAVAPPAPTANPTPIKVASPAPVSTVSTSVGQTTKLIKEISTGAGMALVVSGTDATWKWMQPGAFLEYTVNVTTAGRYGLAVFFHAQQAGGMVTLSVDGADLGTQTLLASGRAPNVMATLKVGQSKIRVTIPPQSVPVDVSGLQLNFPKDPLPDFGKVLAVSASARTVLQPDAVADFYRLQWEKQSWGCIWHYCFIEYLIEVEKPGSYQIAVKHTTFDKMGGAAITVNGVAATTFRFDPLPSGPAVYTPPQTITLPAGTSRLRVADPNRINGEVCWGAHYVEVALNPAP